MNKNELLPVFDESGKQTGESVKRYIAHKDGVPHGASHTYIYKVVNGEIFILLQRRSKEKESFPDMLDVSSAGHMEYGDTFSETALRELREELGITATESDLVPLMIYKYYSEDNFTGEFFKNCEFISVYALKMDVNPKELNLQKEEVSGVVWMSGEDILSELQKPQSEICIKPQDFKRIYSKIKELEHID
ncbi:MAG: NUDIX domain-containing protein [Acutalibacteraceae bacterium]